MVRETNMISIIGLRGDKFFYEEESYKYDPDAIFEEEFRLNPNCPEGNLIRKVKYLKDTKISDGKYHTIKGAKCTFQGSVQALSELLTTLNNK